MTKPAFAGVLAGLLCATGAFGAPAEAQCAVIPVDASCRTSVPPAIRVDFGVRPPAELSSGRKAYRRSITPVDRASARVPLLLRETHGLCQAGGEERQAAGRRLKHSGTLQFEVLKPDAIVPRCGSHR
jgi:hypothetical protein